MVVRQLFAFLKKIKLGLEVNTGIFCLYSVLLRYEVESDVPQSQGHNFVSLS